MPYVFAFFVVVNAGLLGYFVFLHDSKDNTSVMQEKSTLTKEVSFKNTSKDVPPLIGTEK